MLRSITARKLSETETWQGETKQKMCLKGGNQSFWCHNFENKYSAHIVGIMFEVS